MAFRAALGNAIPLELFGAALLWWRFYTFYIYIVLGAIAAGSTVLPALVLTSVASAPVAPLALWPLGFLYGAAVVPAPGGGGAVEMAFRAALGNAIPLELFGAALLWWRFYTFYIYIVLGAIAAGSTVLRAVRKTEDYEVEVESEITGVVS